jgi:hypothetical protein
LRQLVLLGLDPVIRADAGPGPAGEVSDSRRGDVVAMPVVDERQAALFEDRAVLLRELDHALEQGEFEEALPALRSLEAVYGPPAEGPPSPCLESLARASWDSPGAGLDAWTSVETSLRHGPHRRIRTGVFVRLLRSFGPDALVRARPECLPALAAFLESAPGRPAGEGRREARRLVGEALLDGRALEPLDFRHDEPVADTLAEDMPPRWLACLGAVRRLWPAPPLSAAEADPLVARQPDALAAEDPALSFWRCLRVAETPECSDEALHEARRRMKALQPELHNALMRRAPPWLAR